MTIAVPQTAFAPTLFGSSTGTASFASLPTAGHAVIVKIGMPANPGNVVSVTDNQTGNVYALDVGLNNVGSAADFIYKCSSIGTPTGTFTVTVVMSGGSPQVSIMEVSYTGSSLVLDQSNVGNNGAATAATLANASANTSANALVVAGCSVGTAFGSTATSMTTPPGNNGVSGAFTLLMFVDGATSGAPDNGTSAGYKLVSAIETSVATWSWIGTDSNPNVTTLATYKEVFSTAIYDGYSASSATVVTGTSGTAMPAVTVGQFLDVFFRANSSNPGTCTIADTLGNTYTQIDHYDDTTQGYEFYRFRCLVANPGTSQITATYHVAPVNMEIAVGILNGIFTTAPFTSGKVANQRQNTPVSGTNAQTSGNMPALAQQPVLIAGWGYCQGDNNAPSAGTGFTQIGTAWSTINSAASLTYETMTSGLTGPQAATFTPNATNNCFTFCAAFNLPPPPATPFRQTQFFVTDTVMQQ